jgi:iron complex outermembrane receptor protein
MLRFIQTACLFFVALSSFAQNDATLVSTDSLNNLTVQAFYSQTKWKDAPLSISLLNQQKLQQQNPNSLLPAINTITGVRMEERSPGSYRLSIRGSLLRSPFGVRNIKVYWNNMPLSDGGGNTYLQLIEPQNITGVEVIKGPSSSVYGATTSGTVLLKTTFPFAENTKHTLQANVLTGSYNMLQANVGLTSQYKGMSMATQYLHQQTDGYREQSAMRKDAVQWNGNMQWKKQQLSLLLLYTDLFYQTPGGITEAQMLANPTLSRQATATLPSAIQQQAAINNKTLFAGASNQLSISNYFSFQSAVTISKTWFTNPFITNYEIREEDNLGLRMALVYKKNIRQLLVHITTGAELLSNQSAIDNYGNKNGRQDTVQFKDRVKATQQFAFTQLQLSFKKATLVAGVSINQQRYRYKRLPQSNFVQANSNIVATPRLAVLYKVSKAISLYTQVAKGFSPPSLAEIRPSDGNFYSNLQPEQGWNIEAGIKGNALADRLTFDVSLYRFKLRDAIVRRNNSAGAEYFINAGSIVQKGVEAMMEYQLIKNSHHFISAITLGNSFSYQPHRFKEYIVGNTSYAGNALTGVPKTVNVFTANVAFQRKSYINVLINHTSRLPLTDANDAFADAYTLVQIKLGYTIEIRKTTLELIAGVDNLLNQLYSLGNDINALGKRYYNPAPAKNYFVGLKMRLN